MSNVYVCTSINHDKQWNMKWHMKRMHKNLREIRNYMPYRKCNKYRVTLLRQLRGPDNGEFDSKQTHYDDITQP